MSNIKIQTGLRLDELTYNKLKFIAKQENRSLNNLSEFAIQKYIISYEKEHGPIPVDIFQD